MGELEKLEQRRQLVLSELTVQNEELQQRNAELKLRNESLSSEYEKQRLSSGAGIHRIEFMQRQLADVQRTSERLASELELEQAEREKLVVEHGRLAHDNQRLREANDQAAVAELTIGELRQLLSAADATISELRLNNEALRLDVDAFKAKVSEL